MLNHRAQEEQIKLRTNLPSSPSTRCPFSTLTGTIKGFCIKSLKRIREIVFTVNGLCNNSYDNFPRVSDTSVTYTDK